MFEQLKQAWQEAMVKSVFIEIDEPPYPAVSVMQVNGLPLGIVFNPEGPGTRACRRFEELCAFLGVSDPDDERMHAEVARQEALLPLEPMPF